MPGNLLPGAVTKIKLKEEYPMNIMVLEHPRIVSKKHFNDIANTPLWSCLMGGYAAAALQAAGHEVRYLDAAGQQWGFKRTLLAVLDTAPQLLCINAVYFWEHTDKLLLFCQNLRKNGFEGHLNLFGFFPSLAYQVILKSVPAADTLTVGECEITLCELASTLEQGGAWHALPGLAVRKGGNDVRLVKRPAVKDLDALPFPIRPQCEGIETVSILASRGCYNHCSFCLVPSFYNSRALWRGRSICNIVEEIEMLMNKGWRDFYFADPNFIGPGEKGQRRAAEMAERLAPLNITFGMETRPNDLKPVLLEKLCAAGLTSLLMGIESGSAAMLKQLNKGGGLQDASNAITLCRKAGIEPEIGFIMFLPDSSISGIRCNFEFLTHHLLLDRLDRTANLLSHGQIVLMGTTGYKRFQQEKRLEPAGVLGFEGHVRFFDPRVQWLQAVAVPACLHILEQMSQPDSAIYWKKADDAAWRNVNERLVVIFDSLLSEAQGSGMLPEAIERRSQIISELSLV
ncbi:MAG: B12-binding domain-containing radical SAM protein [Desulfobacteraceae bacterium]|nr:B12-binding domain-containing radical SAM protein [Desulfobacteraceae bacterium]